LADDDRPLVALERAGDDLARARGELVHEHDQRIGRLGAAPDGALLVAPLRGADGGDDHAVLEEAIGHARRLLEPSTGVPAKVQHQAAQALLLVQRGELGVELVGGARLKLADAHVADAVRERPRLDGFYLDLLAHELERARALPTFGPVAVDPNRDLGP